MLMLWWLFLGKNSLIWSNPWFLMFWVQVQVLNGPWPHKWGSGQSRVVRSLREDAQAILSQFLEFVGDLLVEAFLHENSFYLVFIAPEIQVKFTMSSESSELDTSFDSDNSEILSLDTKWKMKGIHSASHHNCQKPRVIQATPIMLMLTSHWLMQNG